MRTPISFDRRDWLSAAIAGAILGALILGAGSRLSMRVVGLMGGQSVGFTVGGTMTVVFLGMVSGLSGALVFILLRTTLARHRLVRNALFWLFLGLITLRGLNPVDAQRLLLFMPLVIAYGVALQLVWCRVYLPRRAVRGLAGGTA